MLLPSIFENNFVDNFFNDKFFNDMFSFSTNLFKPASQWMNTNVKDMGNEYQMEIELPGYDKKDIKAQLDNGYLIISADKQETKDLSNENGKYIHRERYSGSCKRRFYVGDQLKEEDFQASFDNGVLKLIFPKDKNEAKIEEKKFISIE